MYRKRREEDVRRAAEAKAHSEALAAWEIQQATRMRQARLEAEQRARAFAREEERARTRVEAVKAAAEEARLVQEEEEAREQVRLQELRKQRLEWKKKEETVEGARSQRGTDWHVNLVMKVSMSAASKVVKHVSS
jgi:hypothetical protein